MFLARRSQDTGLLHELREEFARVEGLYGRGSLELVRTDVTVPAEEIEEIIRRELGADTFPESNRDDFDDTFYGETFHCDCPLCSDRRCGILHDFWDDDDDYDDDDYDDDDYDDYDDETDYMDGLDDDFRNVVGQSDRPEGGSTQRTPANGRASMGPLATALASSYRDFSGKSMPLEAANILDDLARRFPPRGEFFDMQEWVSRAPAQMMRFFELMGVDGRELFGPKKNRKGRRR